MRGLAAAMVGAVLLPLGAVTAAGAAGGLPGYRLQDTCYDRNADTSWECDSWERRLREDNEQRREAEERRRQQDQDRQERQRQDEERRRQAARDRQARWRTQWTR